jgi:hypothetical protein
MRNLEQVVEDFINEAGDDEVGFWRVVKVVRHDFSKVVEADVRAASLKVVEELLHRGVEIIDYYQGRGWTKWPEQSTGAIPARIEREWTAWGGTQILETSVGSRCPNRSNRNE